MTCRGYGGRRHWAHQSRFLCRKSVLRWSVDSSCPITSTTPFTNCLARVLTPTWREALDRGSRCLGIVTTHCRCFSPTFGCCGSYLIGGASCGPFSLQRGVTY